MLYEFVFLVGVASLLSVLLGMSVLLAARRAALQNPAARQSFKHTVIYTWAKLLQWFGVKLPDRAETYALSALEFIQSTLAPRPGKSKPNAAATPKPTAAAENADGTRKRRGMAPALPPDGTQ